MLFEVSFFLGIFPDNIIFPFSNSGTNILFQRIKKLNNETEISRESKLIKFNG